YSEPSPRPSPTRCDGAAARRVGMGEGVLSPVRSAVGCWSAVHGLDVRAKAKGGYCNADPSSGAARHLLPSPGGRPPWGEGIICWGRLPRVGSLAALPGATVWNTARGFFGKERLRR